MKYNQQHLYRNYFRRDELLRNDLCSLLLITRGGATQNCYFGQGTFQSVPGYRWATVDREEKRWAALHVSDELVLLHTSQLFLFNQVKSAPRPQIALVSHFFFQSIKPNHVAPQFPILHFDVKVLEKSRTCSCNPRDCMVTLMRWAEAHIDFGNCALFLILNIPMKSL